MSGSSPSLQHGFPTHDSPASPEGFVLKGAESVADYMGHIGVGGVVAPWAPNRGPSLPFLFPVVAGDCGPWFPLL
jgi:hypothetical protein